MTDSRPDRAAVEAARPTDHDGGFYLPSADSPRRLRAALAAAVAVHALILIAPLPKIEAETPEPDEPVYVVIPEQRFKPPEVPPEPPRTERTLLVPVPDPDPTDPEPLRPLETLEPDLDLPPLDVVTDVPDAPPEPEPEIQGPLPIGGGVIAPVRLEGDDPVYTEAARRIRLECTVILRTVIDATGRVTDIEVVEPCPFGLSEAAVSAVERWRYAPATLRGLPVAVAMNVTTDFGLR